MSTVPLPLDVDPLMDFSRGSFICEDCKAEVIENGNAESVKGSRDRMQRFNHQMRFIREGLRKTEGMVLPAFDVQDWRRKHPSEEAKRAAESDGLKTAGVNGAKKADGMEIAMLIDRDEATRRAEREKAAEAKRQQNIMPSWHTKSTISGDLITLGMLLSNASILRELGRAANGTTSTETRVKVEKQVKPVMNRQSNYYGAYYASLHSSAVPTPTVESWGDLVPSPRTSSQTLHIPTGEVHATHYLRLHQVIHTGRGKAQVEGDGYGFGYGNGGEMALAKGLDSLQTLWTTHYALLYFILL
ncbi:hypothetical protein JB92DRAFT_2983293 [Gautieria morchelliformis]|nr:hypothetical protein JB92DRAFT_2983293 [Gautieria morchelliformis]